MLNAILFNLLFFIKIADSKAENMPILSFIACFELLNLFLEKIYKIAAFTIQELSQDKHLMANWAVLVHLVVFRETRITEYLAAGRACFRFDYLMIAQIAHYGEFTLHNLQD